MDFITATVTVLGPVVGRMLTDVWQDWRTGREVRQGIAISPQGEQQTLSVARNTVFIPASTYQASQAELPIVLFGNFVGEASFVEFADLLLDEEDKAVLIFLVDQESGEMYFFEFGFDGYAISLFPGCYAFYALIVDSASDEVFAFGYPYSDDLEDPNPFSIEGTGRMQIDILVRDVDDL